MNKHNSNHRHSVDALFVITLFCVFAVCSSLLIALGANIYKTTIDSTDRHYTLHTASAFVVEKVHQHDSVDFIDICSFGDGNALKLKEEYGDKTYFNYIYSYNGFMRELLVPDGNNPSPEAGSKILEVSSFNVKLDDDHNLISLSITGINNDRLDNKIFFYSNR